MHNNDNEKANLLTLDYILKNKILKSPDNNNLLKKINSKTLSDGSHEYKIIDSSPLLYPNSINKQYKNNQLILKSKGTPLEQYLFLSQLRQSGDPVGDRNSIPNLKHRFRVKELCKKLKGTILDVGCDIPSMNSQLFPKSCNYIGLDPYSGPGEFRIIAAGEILPFCKNIFNAVVFNSSLDHILDYHTAISEAHRVLKTNGKIIISVYVWKNKATLLTDDVHFHHFRDFEIKGAVLEYFKIEELNYYECPKHNSHRHVMNIMGKK